MKKAPIFAAIVALVCANAFASYIVVLRNGTQYKAKAKWTVVNGKAMIQLESGQTLQLDPSLIDEAKSERTTASGLGNVQILDNQGTEAAPVQEHSPSLGSKIHLRNVPGETSAQPGGSAPSAAASAAGGALGPDVIEKFARAYENVGIFEQNLKSVDANTLRAELTADTEDKVFNAISATSFLMVRNAGVSGIQINTVDLFMKTTNGGTAGRFQMSRADAEALDKKAITQQDYFIRKVIF